MAKTLKELMNPNPVTLESNATAVDAARSMKDAAIGDILVTDKGKLRGIVTDRDLVVRCLAEGKDPGSARLGDVCSPDPVTVGQDEDPARVVQMMKEASVRRIPVVDGDKPVGVVSLGDLAEDRDDKSALAEISAAAPNN